MNSQQRLAPISGQRPTRAATLRASDMWGNVFRSPALPTLGHGQQLAASRLAAKDDANREAYKGLPYSPPIQRAKSPNERGVVSAGTNEAIFSRGKPYAGEKGGFRVTRETGKFRRLILKARTARDAIISALKAEEVVAQAAPVEVVPAKPARTPRAKKAVAE